MLNFSTLLRNDILQAIIDALDSKATPATISFYTSAKPLTGAAITDQVLLGTVLFSSPSGSVASGLLTFNAFDDDISADADGDIVWARIRDGDGNFIFDCDCGLAGSGAVFIFNTLISRIGGVFSIIRKSDRRQSVNYYIT